MNIEQLIEKLEKAKNKLGDVYFETSDSILSVDRVILDRHESIILVNDVDSDHCDCERCKEIETEL